MLQHFNNNKKKSVNKAPSLKNFESNPQYKSKSNIKELTISLKQSIFQGSSKY